MIAALRVSVRAIRHLNGNGFVYVWANVAFLVFSLPLFTMPAAWAGLARLSFYAIRQPHAGFEEFMDGVKEWIVRGIPLAILNLAVVILNGYNLLAYRGVSTVDWALRLFWIAFLVIWFSIQFYLFPLYYAMEKPRLSGALRNAIIMVLFNPLFTLMLSLVLLIIWSFSTVLFALWFLLTFSFMAVLANVAVQDRIRRAGFDQPPAVPEVTDEFFYGSNASKTPRT